VQIGAADRAGADADENLPATGLRLRSIDGFEWLSRGAKDHRSHPHNGNATAAPEGAPSPACTSASCRITRVKLELLSFETTDRLTLPGLLYAPSRGTRSVAIWLHGNGGSSVFYSTTRMNVLGEELTRKGIAFFAFNNRGAETEKSLKRRRRGDSERVQLGFAHETIRDCVHDIDGAILALKARGYRRFHLLGHSTGANKICLYDHRKRKNPASSYVLLGPGDDVGIYYDQLGARRFTAALARAKAMVAAGRGAVIAPGTVVPLPISWASLLDTIDPDGDYNVFPFLEVIRGLELSGGKPLFSEYRHLKRPTLVLLGENDEFCFGDVAGCVKVLETFAPRRVPVEIGVIAETGHSFHGKERELGRRVANWLCSSERASFRRRRR
jgi:pimeloyl-ACP methyl ester carboxylesterase